MVKIKRDIENEFEIDLPILSGGNSSIIELLKSGKLPMSVNNVRLGESIVLGRETAYGDFLDNMYNDVFTLEAELIEIKEKPSIPIGEIGMNAFGKVPIFIDQGNMLRGIIAIGQQDVDYNELIPFDTVKMLGSSSDHIIVDLGDTLKVSLITLNRHVLTKKLITKDDYMLRYQPMKKTENYFLMIETKQVLDEEKRAIKDNFFIIKFILDLSWLW